MISFETGPVFVIAEAGVNHNGSIALALDLVDRVAASGADAIKFQTFSSASTVVAKAAPLAEYMTRSGERDSQEALLDRLCLPPEDFVTIAKACAAAELMFLSTPFDVASVSLLVELGVPALKVPSGEITNPFLLRPVATTGLPLIVSTGMADGEEIQASLDVIRGAWRAAEFTKDPALALLHCTSSYPTPPEAVNLRAIDSMSEAFGLPIGYSDHTIGMTVPIAAVGRGARLIEKHVTLDTAMRGPDHAASLPVADLPALVSSIRDVESALGSGDKQPQAIEADVSRVARRSLAAARDIAAGETFTEDMLTALRPATGISPMKLDLLAARPARRGYRIGELIEVDEIERQ